MNCQKSHKITQNYQQKSSLKKSREYSKIHKNSTNTFGSPFLIRAEVRGDFYIDGTKYF